MTSSETMPVVSIVVPCRNEFRHIERCLTSLLGQVLSSPEDLEVLVVDGLSEDGTRDILIKLAMRHPRLRVLDNHAKNTGSGMNIGIRAARGRYVAILGAHAEYASDYVKRCVQLLELHPEVCCAGGPIVSRGRSIFGRAVAVAMSHPMGVGNARHRFADYEGYAEAVCFPVLRKEVFDKVGFFDEQLVRNQDDDFYYRVRLSGERLFLSPTARCTYFVRDTIGRLFKQYYEYGLWRIVVIRKHGRPASIRQLAPGALLTALTGGIAGVLFLSGTGCVVSAVIPVSYGVALATAAIGLTREHGARIGSLFPIAVATMHFAYGLGFLWGSVTNKRLHESIDRDSMGSCHAHL